MIATCLILTMVLLAQLNAFAGLLLYRQIRKERREAETRNITLIRSEEDLVRGLRHIERLEEEEEDDVG